jgi:tRNA dimethylallyltransferase
VVLETSESPVLVAIVGPTATGKSTLAIKVAQRFNGEVVSCDSTAVYKGFDIGTDKVPMSARQGIPHHLIDVVDGSCYYSAAQYARDAKVAIENITERGRLPILVGGSGLYYRALTRGLFDGPGRDDQIRTRLTRIAGRRGVEYLHRLVGRVDPASAKRIQQRDQKRLIRALEVYYLTGRPLTDHFDSTRSPIDAYHVIPFALHLAAEEISRRVKDRVDEQFQLGIIDEINSLLDGGLSRASLPFGGLVYRQVLEYLDGVRDEQATRELIAQENRRYAKRQLIWFRKEPNLRWINVSGERPDAFQQVATELQPRLR